MEVGRLMVDDRMVHDRLDIFSPYHVFALIFLSLSHTNC